MGYLFCIRPAYKVQHHQVFRKVRDNSVFSWLLKLYGESGFLAEPCKMGDIWTGGENWVGMPGRGLSKRKSIGNENLLEIELWTLPPSLPSISHPFNTDWVEAGREPWKLDSVVGIPFTLEPALDLMNEIIGSFSPITPLCSVFSERVGSMLFTSFISSHCWLLMLYAW